MDSDGDVPTKNLGLNLYDDKRNQTILSTQYFQVLPKDLQLMIQMVINNYNDLRTQVEKLRRDNEDKLISKMLNSNDVKPKIVEDKDLGTQKMYHWVQAIV